MAVRGCGRKEEEKAGRVTCTFLIWADGEDLGEGKTSVLDMLSLSSLSI